MLNLILSHWAMYLYLPYVIALLVLLVVYHEQPVRIYRKLRRLPSRSRQLATQWRLRPRSVR